MSVVSSRLAAPAVVSLVGAGDPGSSRVVYAMVIGLVVIGFVLIGVGIWILRQTRADLEVLAPLERMGDGDWKKRDPSTQRRMLDELRPEGAQPLRSTPMAPPIDAEFEQHEHPVASFSDLGPGVAAEQHRDPTPPGTPTPLEDVQVEPDDARAEPEDAEVEPVDVEVEPVDVEVEPEDAEVEPVDAEVESEDARAESP